MKIAIPTMGEKGLREAVCEHFGSAPFFTVVDPDTQAVEVVNNQNMHHDHGHCNPVAALDGKGVEVVLCHGMGQGAADLLRSKGIKVYRDQGTATLVSDLLDQYQQGKLQEFSSAQACAGHDCH